MKKTDAKNSPTAPVKRRTLNNTGILLIITISLFVLLYGMSVFLFNDSGFSKFTTLFNIFFNQKAYLLMLSLGLTVVMITGSIDISVGGVTGLISMVIAVMLTEHGVHAYWTIPAALGIGLAFGAAQGFLISYMEIQPFIVTLSGMFFARGMIAVINPNSVPINDKIFGSWTGAKVYIPFLYNVNKRGIRDVAFITPAGIISIAVLIILIIALKRTKFGRSLYAVGGSRQSAMLMGIDVRRAKFLAHVLCGLLAGIGGLLYTMGAPSGNPRNGLGYEINAISSSVIGGAMLSGGGGLPIGTFFGVLIYALVERVVPLLKLVDASWPTIITSAFLFAFIVLQSILSMAGKSGGGFKLPEWLKFKGKR